MHTKNPRMLTLDNKLYSTGHEVQNCVKIPSLLRFFFGHTPFAPSFATDARSTVSRWNGPWQTVGPVLRPSHCADFCLTFFKASSFGPLPELQSRWIACTI